MRTRPGRRASVREGSVVPQTVEERWNTALGCETSGVALAILEQVVALEHPPNDAPGPPFTRRVTSDDVRVGRVAPASRLEAESPLA